MSDGTTAFSAELSFSISEKLCRQMFFQLMAHLPEGYLEIQESGSPVAAFGEQSDPLKAHVNILCPSAYRALLIGGSVASGETYMEGLWTTRDLTSVIRIFARNLSTLDKWEQRFKWLSLPLLKLQHFLRNNTAHQAKKNIAAHYDLGNTLYSRFLDPSMMYSAAIYPTSETTLAQAQQHKMKTICEKLQLSQTDHLLEIGTGWGGLAVYAAKHYGCKVTTTTISEEQHEYARQWIEQEGLASRITLLKQDYRQLSGKFDKLVSVEMIEAVGRKYLSGFISKCSELLQNNGQMLIQCITIDDRRYENYANSVDFIQKYIFPGGFLPSQYALTKLVKDHSNLSIRDIHDIGLDYARTLDDWYRAFDQAREQLKQDGYDEKFARLWCYYLKYCEGGFVERAISAVQILLTKPAYRGSIARH